jgi:hypothetical protein
MDCTGNLEECELWVSTYTIHPQFEMTVGSDTGYWRERFIPFDYLAVPYQSNNYHASIIFDFESFEQYPSIPAVAHLSSRPDTATPRAKHGYHPAVRIDQRLYQPS